jgi:phospholipid/cholesterol/gamma-HCH transport system substrate-binding protein
MENLNRSTKGLDENMEALKHNIFFRGYYNKKLKAEAEAAAAKDKENKEEKK